MAKRGRSMPLLVVASALLVALRLCPAFVPPPRQAESRRPARASAAAPLGAAAGLAGAVSAACATPLEDAAVKFADSSYPILKKLDKNQIADLVSDVVSKTNYDAKVATVVDKAVEALLLTPTDVQVATFQAINKAIDNALAKKSIIPPLEDVEGVAKAVAVAIEAGSGDAFRNFVAAAKDQGSAIKLLQGIKGVDASTKDAFADLVAAASATEGKGVPQTGSGGGAPGALEDAAVKFADASYPIVETLNGVGGKTVAPLVGKGLGIAFSGDPLKVGKAADAAIDAILSISDQSKVIDVLKAADSALDAAAAKGGLLPPVGEVEGVAKAAAGALSTVGPGKLNALLGAVVDAANSGDKFKILGIVGEGSGLVAKINPADVASATSAALALASAAGAK